MAATLKRLFGPAQLGNVAATVYTVPASTTATIRHIVLCNTTGAGATFTMSIGADAAGTRLYQAVSVNAGATVEYTGNYVLAAAEVLQMYASAATTITASIFGVEVTA